MRTTNASYKRRMPRNDPTVPAKRVWRFLFPGEKWPEGWKVHWKWCPRTWRGLTIWTERVILLSYTDTKKNGDAVSTLIHELVHVRYPDLRHGREFSRITNQLLAKMGLPGDE